MVLGVRACVLAGLAGGADRVGAVCVQMTKLLDTEAKLEAALVRLAAAEAQQPQQPQQPQQADVQWEPEPEPDVQWEPEPYVQPEAVVEPMQPQQPEPVVPEPQPPEPVVPEVQPDPVVEPMQPQQPQQADDQPAGLALHVIHATWGTHWGDLCFYHHLDASASTIHQAVPGLKEVDPRFSLSHSATFALHDQLAKQDPSLPYPEAYAAARAEVPELPPLTGACLCVCVTVCPCDCAVTV